MKKKLKPESAKYLFLSACQSLGGGLPARARQAWDKYLDGLQFEDKENSLRVKLPEVGKGEGIEIPVELLSFYVRGDSPGAVSKQSKGGLTFSNDLIKSANWEVMLPVAGQVLDAFLSTDGPQRQCEVAGERFKNEKDFHDGWANTVDVNSIDIYKVNEACTAPELRFIHRRLGDLRGRSILDVGCGLGEVSVYFALRGAAVTATDISSGMLDATSALAARHGVSVKTHLATAEGLQLLDGATFDVIYAGNLLHHVDIPAALAQFHRHLAAGGRLVIWDPIAYNPIINVYRKMAHEVRTKDEHPLRWKDLTLFEQSFDKVERRYFWLTTLSIFLIMALFQRRSPNKERYWKVILDEEKRWRPIYRPLEWIDRLLLALIPPLRLLCWNVVVVATKSVKG